jgi:hypothetical protein
MHAGVDAANVAMEFCLEGGQADVNAAFVSPAATYTAAKFAASARETACRETAVKQEAWQTASACICRRDLIGYRTPNGEVEVLLTLWDLGAIENLAGS